MQGQTPKGAHLLCSGRAKLFTGSEDGRAIILGFADPGEVLGLNALFTGSPYEKSALAIEDVCVGFVKRKDFLLLLEDHPEAALAALKQLSVNYQQAHAQLCWLGLSTSVSEKLAKLLLQWCNGSSNGDGVRIRRGHSHSEIADMIGASRETVTRLLGGFRDRGILTFTKAELVIPDPDRLRLEVGAHRRNGFGNGHGRL
jgi:CRP/FNR family transcriptional regulator